MLASLAAPAATTARVTPVRATARRVALGSSFAPKAIPALPARRFARARARSVARATRGWPLARKTIRARRVWRSRGPESRAPSSRRAPQERRASPSSLPSFRRACASGRSRTEGQGGKRPGARRLADQASRDEFKATSREAQVDEETHAAFAEEDATTHRTFGSTADRCVATRPCGNQSARSLATGP